MTLGDISAELGKSDRKWDNSKAIVEWNEAVAAWEKEKKKEKVITPGSLKRRRTAAEVFADLDAAQSFPDAAAERATDAVQVGDAVEE